MKVKDLNEEQIEAARSIYWDKTISWDNRMKKLMHMFEKSERTVRHWCSKELKFKKQHDIMSEQYNIAKIKDKIGDKKRYLITYAQNNTPIHKELLKNMEAYAEFIDAEILVIAGRYSNGMETLNKDTKESWASEVLPYLTANRISLCENLVVLGDIKIQTTNMNPLAGLSNLTGLHSSIVGHPRVHMEVIGALEGYEPKIMLTTGTITKKNYTDSRIGKIGEFHHTYGFIVAEIKNDKKFFVRQVTALENGEFSDLYFNVKAQTITNITNIAGAVLGDIHLGCQDEAVMDATKTLLDRLRPEHTVIHDIVDFYSISHHEIKDPIKMYRKSVEGKDVVKTEIDNMIKWVSQWKQYNLVIVRSNHDDFIDRWIVNMDWKKNIINSVEYMEYTKVLLEAKAPKGIVPYILDTNFTDVKTLGILDSFKIKDFETGFHGDYGMNGARGSIPTFRKLSTKMIVGHSHVPSRKDGVLQVGTSTKLRLGYNLGISSWLNTHAIIHNNGKAQLINFIDGEFTTFE
jgi:hypothetical protein